MKTIILKPNGIGRYDDVSPFILADGKFGLNIVLPNVNGEFYLIVENNGTTQSHELLRDGAVTIENLSAGVLNAEIKHYLKGELIKTYKVEPLILKEVDATLSATPEIADLERVSAELRNTVAEQKRVFDEQIAALSEALENERRKVAALVKFAYADYENNVYLGGGSLEQFLKEFGFRLSEEEINAIKGVEKNE